MGKSSLIRRFVVDRFDDIYLRTIGNKVTKKDIVLKEDHTTLDLSLLIFEVYSDKSHPELHEKAYQGAEGAFFVCDATRPESIESIKDYWLPSLMKVTGKIPFIMIFNKMDLVAQIAPNLREYELLFQKYSLPYLKTSAKTGDGVLDAFTTLSKMMIQSKVVTKIENGFLIPGGYSYLIFEEKTNLTYDFFVKAIGNKVSGIWITSLFPDKIAEKYGIPEDNIVWLTEVSKEKNAVDPKYMEDKLIALLTEFIRANKNSIILIDCLDYLFMYHPLENIVRFIKNVLDESAYNKCTVLVPCYPGIIPKNVITGIARFFDKVGVAEDILTQKS